MTNSAVHFEPEQFKFRSGRERGRKDIQSLLDGVELRAALAADGDDGLGHSLWGASPDCNGTARKFSRRILGA